MVVANELNSRYDQVELVLAGGEERTIYRRRTAGAGVRQGKSWAGGGGEGAGRDRRGYLPHMTWVKNSGGEKYY